MIPIFIIICSLLSGCAGHFKQPLTEETIRKFIADGPMVAHIYSRPPSEKIIENLPNWPGVSYDDVQWRLIIAQYNHFYEKPYPFAVDLPFSVEEMQLIDKYEAKILDTLYLIDQTYIYTDDEFVTSLNILKLLNNYLKSIDTTPMTREQFDEMYKLSESAGVNFARLFQVLFARAGKALDKKWEGRPLDMVAPYLTSEEIRVAKKYADELKTATDEYQILYLKRNPNPHPRETRSFYGTYSISKQIFKRGKPSIFEEVICGEAAWHH